MNNLFFAGTIVIVSLSTFARGAGLSSIKSIEKTAENEFKVTCADTKVEKVSEQKILQNLICGANPQTIGYTKLIANVDGSVSLYTPWVSVKNKNHRLGDELKFGRDIRVGFCKMAGYKTATEFHDSDLARPGTPLVALDQNGQIRYAREAGRYDFWANFVSCVK